MTRRERMEARAEKRRQWAASREAKSSQAYAKASAIIEHIPLGQPILVGHHSERHHRRDIDRMGAAMSASVEHSKMADHHVSRAGGIERQLETSIFSDDPDAIENLQSKAAELTAKADRCKAINAAFRKAPGADTAAKLAAMVEAGTLTRSEALRIASSMAACHWEKLPYPAYHLSGLRANARRALERIKEVTARNIRTAEAAAAGGVRVVRVPIAEIYGGGARAVVTFAERPSNATLAALRAASFHYSGGSWHGNAANLPACIEA